VANPAAAAAALADANTSPADLAEIARLHPEYGAKVAAHPNAYPGLLDWLAQYGNDAARAAVQQVRQNNAEPVDMTVPSLPSKDSESAVDDPSQQSRRVASVGGGTRCGHCGATLTRGPFNQCQCSSCGWENTGVLPVDAGTAGPAPTTPSPSVVRDTASELKQMWKGDSNDKTGSWLDRLEIIWSAGKFIIIAVVVVVVAIFGMHSCAASSSAKNVTCSQFNAMSLTDQQNTLNALLSAHKKQTGGSNLMIAEARAAAGCFGNPSAKVDSVISWN